MLKCNRLFYTALAISFVALPVYSVQASDLTDISLEALTQVEVISASKKKQKGVDVPSAIYVISSSDIQRSGARSIPEALKMVPGLNAGKIDANKWAVGIRGNTGRFSNRLLVMIDGRSVYNPAFSGIYWEAQDVLLSDVAQIEVIRGPGGTIWGANAVNGIINIITKQSQDTEGLLASVIAGHRNDKANVDLRYGTKIGDQAHVRIYGKYNKKDSFINQLEENNQDNWKMKHGGMRADWTGAKNKLTVQGDLYRAQVDEIDLLSTQTGPAPTFLQKYTQTLTPKGWNLSGKWDSEVSDKTSFGVQAYYDVAKRMELIGNQEQKTVDIDANLNHILNETNNLSVGLGVKRLQDKYEASQWMSIANAPTFMVYSGFLQDEISLVPQKWIMTLGSKVEHHGYTGFEFQPSARLSWKQDSGNFAWASVSRGVRTPSRIERENSKILVNITNLGGPVFAYSSVQGQKDFESEKLIAYEAGYRWLSLEKAVFDITGFFNDYDKLRSTDIGDPQVALPVINQPIYFRNNMYGHTYGAELSAEYKPFAHWEIKAAYAELRQDFGTREGSTDITSGIYAENDSPHRKLSLFSKYSVNEKWDIDVWLKYTGRTGLAGVQPEIGNTMQPIPSYLVADLRLAYKINKSAELSFVAQNLNKHRHVEAIDELVRIPAYIPRGYYLQFKYEA